jgi:DNA adenine methylase
MNSKSSSNLKPFVKWAGGKTQFLEIINLLSPNSYDRLIEPFVGGGSVFLNLKRDNLIINDVNQELIKSYRVIKDNPLELLKILVEYEKRHSKIFYEEIRSLKLEDLNDLEISARFIYLNKTCFNGLYRVNSSGGFNVPIGSKKENATIFSRDGILSVNRYLNDSNIKILNDDYKNILDLVNDGDFLFVDPPYDNENDKGFTSYSVGGFNKDNQRELFNFLKEVDKKGAKWLLTNHNTSFIQDLYKEYPFFTKKANRFINPQGDKRLGAAKEVFIWNYQLTIEQERLLSFEKYFDTIQHTNISLENLVGWERIEENLLTYKDDIVDLNYLVGNEDDLEKRIDFLWEKNSKSFRALPFLLAIKNDEFCWINQGGNSSESIIFWEEDGLNLEKVKDFIINSNLTKLFINPQIKSLVDYALGLEVGLDTHVRKNRTGKIMENAIEKLLIDYKVDYKKQVPYFFNNKKVLDFSLKIEDKIYYCETNFFNSPGSKISEVIRSYSHIYQVALENGVSFMWIGDGKGLKSVKKNLKDIFFSTNEFLFTINSFEKWIKDKTSKKILN